MSDDTQEQGATIGGRNPKWPNINSSQDWDEWQALVSDADLKELYPALSPEDQLLATRIMAAVVAESEAEIRPELVKYIHSQLATLSDKDVSIVYGLIMFLSGQRSSLNLFLHELATRAPE
jgi:hypothetical protein